MTGVGGPILAIPALAALLGVEHAVVVMAIPGLAMNGWLLWRHRRARTETRDLPVLLICGILGLGLGTWGPRRPGRARAVAGPRRGDRGLPRRRLRPTDLRDPAVCEPCPVPLVGVASGAMQGSTGISAPVVATYVHGLDLPRAEYILSVSALFLVFAVAQVVLSATVGLYTGERLLQSGLAVLPALAMPPVGDRIGRRLSATTSTWRCWEFSSAWH